MKTQDNRDRIAAIYVRLSEEDHDKVHETDDSLSIQNQKSMLLEFASKHGWTVYDIYNDDDYAGADISSRYHSFTSPLICLAFLLPLTDVSAPSTMPTNRIPQIGKRPWMYFSRCTLKETVEQTSPAS